ncbi:MAG: ATP-binding cassette domain-containing protein [Actinomycetia bacterium]|nr:ATP-binding cassette domain-containing protein [Actinomycetes bacterium]
MSDDFLFSGLRFPGDGSVISDLSLSVGVGERLVLFGPNGGGKTTILRLLAGTTGRSAMAEVAYLPQTPYMFRGTLEKNLVIGLTNGEATAARDLAAVLGLGALFRADAQRLSGGQAQRVGLARTLASAADLVLLDEPLAAINAADADDVARLIRNATSTRALIAVSHRIETVVALGDRVAIVDGGRILQDGPPSEVMASPVDDRVAAIIGIGNVVQGTVVVSEDGLTELDCDGFALFVSAQAKPGQLMTARFGAETVALYASRPVGGTQRNVLSGNVTDIVSRGRLAEVIVDVGRPIAALVTPGALDALALDVGHEVWVAVKAASISVARAD